MDSQMQHKPLTYESLMASIHESNRFLTEKFAETVVICDEHLKVY